MVELLISKGANINAKANDGRTPLDIAISQGQTAIVDILKAAGAEPGAKDVPTQGSEQ